MFFVLHIFSGVIVDEHPIFWVVGATVSNNKDIKCHPLWHHRRCTKQKGASLFAFLFRIVLFLHFISVIYLSKIFFHCFFIGIIWIITPFLKIHVSVQVTKLIAYHSWRCVIYICIQMQHASCDIHMSIYTH